MASFLEGITDFAKSVLDKAPAVITAVNSNKGPNTVTLDAYGRAPGQVGYGTAIPPATQPMPTWVKPVAIGLGVLLVVLLAIRFLLPRKKGD